VLSAVELNVFGALAGGPLPAEELRRKVGVHPRGARDFFDALTALGLLRRDRAGRYATAAAAARFLDPASPAFVAGSMARSYGVWAHLTEGLVSGAPQNEQKEGVDFYQAHYVDPDRLRAYMDATTNLNLPVSRAVASRFPWGEHRRFLDLGSAQGGLAVEVALRHPAIRGIGFDSPRVQPLFEEYVRRHGVADRLRFVGGDFFRDPLPGADVVVLGHVLHTLDLGQKQQLLGRCFDALEPGGVCLVYELLVDDERRTAHTALLSSLNLLLDSPGGFEFSAAECRTWMHAAGFGDVTVHPLVRSESLVAGRKPRRFVRND
jgi:SAM-dependent methyltransferase